MFTDPEKNVSQLFLRDGMLVADLGAGSGAYSISASRKVGESGRVYAIEVQKDLLGNIKSKAKQEHLDNIEVLWGNIEDIGGTKMEDNVVDAVILSNILFQVEDKEGTLKESMRILKSGGNLLIVDWSDSFDGLGPQKEDIVGKENAKRLAEGAGFSHERDIDAGAHHYGMIFKKR